MISRVLVSVVPLSLIHFIENLFLRNYSMSKNLLAKSNPDLLELISQRKALLMFKKAVLKVPAYQKFLKVNKIDHLMVKSFSSFIESGPLTTKGNYVKKYSFENRSINGVLPSAGLIEESSGSSGHPTNWIKNFKWLAKKRI